MNTKLLKTMTLTQLQNKLRKLIREGKGNTCIAGYIRNHINREIS